MKGDKSLRVLVAIPLLFVLGCLFVSCGDSDEIDDYYIFPVDVTDSDSGSVSDTTGKIPGKEPIKFSELKIGETTNVIFSARNLLIEDVEREGVRYLRVSKDLGNTWKEFENTYGDLVYIHLFSTGDILFATKSWCYYIDRELSSIMPSQVYDYNGSIFKPVAKEHFYVGDCKNYIWKIDGVEILVWGDYSYGGTNDPNYVARVWYTTDCGHSVKCAIKFNETKIDGKVQKCRHTHGLRYDRFDKVFYIPTGDAGEAGKQCQLISGKYDTQSDTWDFHRIGSGYNYKFSRIYFDKEYAYLMTDYTTKEFPTGIIKCKKDSLHDSSKFEYLYMNEDYCPVTSCEFDMNGNKLVTPDGTGKTFIFYARGNYSFKKIPTSQRGWITGFTSPNYNGEVYARICSAFPFYQNRCFNFTKSMRNSGVVDYMDIKEPKSLYFDEDFFFNYQYE